MKLNDFILEQQAILQVFREWAEAAQRAEKLPLELPSSEWDKQLRFFGEVATYED